MLLKLQHLQNSHILTSPCDNIAVMFLSWTLKVGLNQPSCQECVPLESVLRVLSAALSDSASGVLTRDSIHRVFRRGEDIARRMIVLYTTAIWKKYVQTRVGNLRLSLQSMFRRRSHHPSQFHWVLFGIKSSYGQHGLNSKCFSCQCEGYSLWRGLKKMRRGIKNAFNLDLSVSTLFQENKRRNLEHLSGDMDLLFIAMTVGSDSLWWQKKYISNSPKLYKRSFKS